MLRLGKSFFNDLAYQEPTDQLRSETSLVDPAVSKLAMTADAQACDSAVGTI